MSLNVAVFQASKISSTAYRLQALHYRLSCCQTVTLMCAAHFLCACCVYLLKCSDPAWLLHGRRQTELCPNGTFREGWKPAAEATECTPCGDGVMADRADGVTLFDAVTGAPREVAVSTNQRHCCK